MFGKKTTEVLIAGAGPVGLFAALELSRRGIEVQIADTGLWPCTRSYALALHASTLGLLRQAGLYDRVMENARAVDSVGLYDASGRKATVRLQDDAGGSLAIAVVRQDVLERLLERALEERGVRVSWRNEVSGLEPGRDSVAVTIDRYEKQSRGYVVAGSEWVIGKTVELEARYVIGADGYASKVRQAAGIGFPEVAPAAYYAVFEMECEGGHGGEMRLVVNQETTDVFWPLPGGRVRWSFQIPGGWSGDPSGETPAAGAPAARLKDRRLVAGSEPAAELDEETFHRLVAERAPWFAGSGTFRWRALLRFERRLAASFGSGRLWLAGDAAHLTGPAGVQSMNAGLAEAQDLAARLEKALRAKTREPFEGYDARWQSEWRRLHGLDGGPRVAADADPWLASRASRLVECLPAHGPALAALGAQAGLLI